jgi:putative PEP-CTERM system histidine kinase
MPASFAALSFLSCALAYAGLALMLRPARFGRGAPRFRLRLAALMTSVWAVGTWLAAGAQLLTVPLAHLFAIMLLSLWVWQLEPLARWQGQPEWFQRVLRWSGAVISGATVALIASGGGSDTTDRILYARVLPTAGLLLASLGLFALEQIYRNAPHTARAAVRWLCLGFGGIFVAELVFFAQSLLLGGVQIEPWVARGVVLAVCALVIARGALHMPDWSFGMSISRHVVFYTTSFVAIGAYLLLLSFGGWLLLQSAGDWGLITYVAFWLIASATLVALLFSSRLLRWLRAFITKHFYPHRYDYRLEWLRFIGALSDPSIVSVPERCTRAVAQIVEAPTAALWRKDQSGSCFECAVRWGEERGADRIPLAVPVDDALPTFLSRKSWLIDLVELRGRHDRYDYLPLLPGRYGAPDDGLIVPLLHIDQLYGWLVLARPDGLAELTFEDRDLLKTAGRQIAAYLSQHDADARLAEARQFEAYNRMTAFVMHDLKNIAAQLRLISQNAERHKRNPEFIDDAMRTIGTSAGRMTKLIAQLTTGETSTMRTVDLADIVERAAIRRSSTLPVPQVLVSERPTAFADAERLAAVIEHAISNAQEATPPTGEVRIEVSRADSRPVISIVDTGCGMDEHFVRERLFRPFDTTKGTKGMGIGAFQIREYLLSLGGSVQVDSTTGVGTRFTLLFPSDAQMPAARLIG